MNRFTSRKFLSMVGIWLYGIGGLLSGQLTTEQGLTALGLSGGVFVLVEGLIDAIRAWRGPE